MNHVSLNGLIVKVLRMIALWLGGIIISPRAEHEAPFSSKCDIISFNLALVTFRTRETVIEIISHALGHAVHDPGAGV